MSDIQISIQPTVIREVMYNNTLIPINAKPVRLEVRHHTKVLSGKSMPLSAVFEVTFQAVEPDNARITLEILTATPVTVSSYIENLDKVIQKEYLPSIMLAVNEKLRMVTAALDLNIRIPNFTFAYENKQHD